MNKISIEKPNATSEKESRYLVFRVGKEFFGTQLLQVREVVEQPKLITVPCASKAFSGVVTIRDEVVSVIDLRVKFEMPFVKGARTSMLIFDLPMGTIGAIVDKIEYVAHIKDKDIESGLNLKTKIRSEFIRGIAKQRDTLLTIVDFSAFLDAEDIFQIKIAP